MGKRLSHITQVEIQMDKGEDWTALRLSWRKCKVKQFIYKIELIGN